MIIQCIFEFRMKWNQWVLIVRFSFNFTLECVSIFWLPAERYVTDQEGKKHKMSSNLSAANRVIPGSCALREW